MEDIIYEKDYRNQPETEDDKRRSAILEQAVNGDFFKTYKEQIWWYIAPTVINTFLESYEMTGKTIIPFATSGGSDMGKTNEKLLPSCKGAKLLDGKVFKATVSGADLAEWAEGLENK